MSQDDMHDVWQGSRFGALLLWTGCTLLTCRVLAQEPPTSGPPRDPYKHIYASYEPDFLRRIQEGSGYGGPFRGWVRGEKEMRLSSEPGFFTLNLIREDARANALIGAGLKREDAGKYLDALKVYQIVIEKYPEELYRVSKYGVFVPAAQYAQRRILGFPPLALARYRTLHDARAKEAFEHARRKHSLIGLSEIVDAMLATSYGARAVVELGNAALDAGHHLEALERYSTIRAFFPDPRLRTPALDLKIGYCHKMLGSSRPGLADGKAEGELSADQLDRFRQVLSRATPELPPFHSQLASEPYVAADDYTLFPPTADPLCRAPGVWTHDLPGSRASGWQNQEHHVFTQPVVTNSSVIYRYKNIVYCRSILNGELRWQNDLGGRAAWQNRNERQYPSEDIVVQDGLVFTTVSKGGPSLVALDEVTGQLRWAYGPMVAATREEARMRFEAAPAGGPRAIYAGYVLDNIEGETHTDTEYGLIAFDSATGRLRWRKPLCGLAPGKFSAGFAVKRRNRIRSFISPPLYHQGTVYYNTNAGAIVALDSRSGRIKWLMRYPYWPGVHDATRQFGALVHTGHWYKHPVRPHVPMFWYNQRPLLVGESLYVVPVDTRLMLCLDRRTGKVRWSRAKGGIDSRGRVHGDGSTYLLGPTREGHLVVVGSGRLQPVRLLDPRSGKVLWTSPDLILHDDQPVMKHRGRFLPYPWASIGINRRWFTVTVRPFLTQDDTLYVSHVAHVDTGYSGAGVQGWTYHLAQISLPSRQVVDRRRYYSPQLRVYARQMIDQLCPQSLKAFMELPHKDDNTKANIAMCREIINDSVPVNRFGPFTPASRITFRRYGVLFEFRFNVRRISMVYDRSAVLEAIRPAPGVQPAPETVFAQAELLVADARYEAAAQALKRCLAIASSEDLDLRAMVNQLLFRIHRRLVGSGIRSGDRAKELANCLGMSRTASTLAEEVETLFALSEAYERRGDAASAARCLRSVISTYGHHEYPVSSIAVAPRDRFLPSAGAVIDRAANWSNSPFYGEAFRRSLDLIQKGLPLYLSTVSPVEKDLTVRVGELAAARLARLQKTAPEFAKTFETRAKQQLVGRPAEEQLYRLWEFPATATAQSVLAALFEQAARQQGFARQERLWRLADAARICGLTVPSKHLARVAAPKSAAPSVSVDLQRKAVERHLAEAEGVNWLVLERRGQRHRHPSLLYLGGRVRKRLDNKFIIRCYDLGVGSRLWERRDIRLRGKGQEPGFFDAFVCGDIVVVHGLYDVLAFDARSGKLLWRYRVPFDFEIKHAVMSGDLLVLSGETETVALHLLAASPAGQVVWQEKEMGDLYAPPYFHGDRLISVRKMPFNLTVRYRSTGKLMGRLTLPDLTLFDAHPLLERGPRTLPIAHDGRLLVVSDGWYYIAIDVEKAAILWKRLIDQNDLTREPPLRFALNGEFLAVVKQDYDVKTLYMLSSRTGTVLWHTDPKNAKSPQPVQSMFIRNGTLYGIGVFPGQGFYFVGRDCRTGQLRFSELAEGYGAKPVVRLIPKVYGQHAAVEVQDRQDFELKVYDVTNGKLRHTMKKKGVGPFGVHGRVSATVQSGRAVLLSKDKLSL